MSTNTTYKTGWFHLGLIVIMTITSFWFIKEALAKTYIQWEQVNETRVSKIQSLLDE